jgi:hypothetical protein
MDADPNNFNLMYASSWDKDRKAWNFLGVSGGSTIYKVQMLGSNWAKFHWLEVVSQQMALVRIGLAVFGKYGICST